MGHLKEHCFLVDKSGKTVLMKQFSRSRIFVLLLLSFFCAVRYYSDISLIM